MFCSLLLRYYSIYLGYTFSPPRMMRSLLLPTIVKQPCSSSVARSPDFIQPSTMLFSLAVGSSQQPCMTAQPLRQNSPEVPMGQVLPLLSMILASSPSKMVPTLVVLWCMLSFGLVWKETGEVSVMPQQFVMSFICKTWMILFMSASGASEPAIIPVLRLFRSYFSGLASQTLRYSENIVGTPQRDVHLYLETAYRALTGSKPWHTQVSEPPLVRAARFPMTIPKQWYSGTGTQMLSFSEYPHFSPIASPLFRML